MSLKYLKCDVDLTRFLIAYLEKGLTKKGEPFKWSAPDPLHPWYRDFAKLRKSRNVEAQYLAGMLRWVFEKSDFWNTVIRSPDSLKKHFEKIQSQMEAPRNLTTFEKKRASIDDYFHETAENVSRGTLTNKQFSFGMKVLLSCGGPNVDTDTLAVWYRMLSDLDPVYFDQAIQHICKNEESPQTLNMVQKIRELHDTLRGEAKRLKSAEKSSKMPWIQDRKDHPERYMSPEELKTKIRALTKVIGN